MMSTRFSTCQHDQHGANSETHFPIKEPYRPNMDPILSPWICWQIIIFKLIPRMSPSTLKQLDQFSEVGYQLSCIRQQLEKSNQLLQLKSEIYTAPLRTMRHLSLPGAQR